MNIQSKVTLPRHYPGLSIAELTLVLSTLLLVIGLLFLGARTYKAGTDRAACILNIHHVQNAVRSYSNLQGLAPGETLSPSQDLRGQLVGPDCYFEGIKVCPAGGSYADLGNRIPAAGELYLSCSLAEDQRHVPQLIDSW